MKGNLITVDNGILVLPHGHGHFLITVYDANVYGTKYMAITSNTRLVDAYNDSEENPKASHNATIDLIDFVMLENGIEKYKIS